MVDKGKAPIRPPYSKSSTQSSRGETRESSGFGNSFTSTGTTPATRSRSNSSDPTTSGSANIASLTSLSLDSDRDENGVPYHLQDPSPQYEEQETGNEGQARDGRERMNIRASSNMTSFEAIGPGLESRARIDEHGKINISLNLKKTLPDLPQDYARPVVEYAVDPSSSNQCPPLNVVIFIVGSRGDVQPYISLALELIRSNGHRVRIATHGDFKAFVLDANAHLKGQLGPRGDSLEGKLEFFDAGGDPKELMAYMVKNPGLLPGLASLTNGDVGSKRRMTQTLLRGFFKSTFYPDNRNGPFAADAIISNPPAFAHIHVAEALGLPLLMSFTMPWSPTTEFSHPLVNVKESNAGRSLTNYLSYAMADMMMWQGLGDLINSFRSHTLGLDKLSLREGPSLLDRMKVPWTYCWSSGLIPQPKDWKQHIDISGFYFLEEESGYDAPTDLMEFLQAGEPPIYIGFGSVPVKHPEAMTKTIFEGVRKAGVRALVSAGWGGLGGLQPPPGVYLIQGSIPHDWLFANGRVKAVVHHGGAGTTAIGLRNGLPTTVVPFFGDQQFWGDMIRAAGAGPHPLSPKHITPESLAEAIQFCLSPDAQAAAQAMGEQIRTEGGVKKGVDSFHRHLPLLNMRCELDPKHNALWWSKELFLRISGVAAAVLQQEGYLQLDKLEPHRPREYETGRHFTDPWNGGVSSILNVISTSVGGVAELFYKPGHGLVQLGWGIPLATVGVVNDFYEGLDNIPQLLGSDTRQKGKVRGWKSGFREGGKGLAYGIWDGVTGLVTEPIVGARQEGAAGVAKGFGRSLVNLGARPAAGALGFFTLPIRGMYRSAVRKIHAAPDRVLRGPRIQISEFQAAKLTKEQRQAIVERYKVLEQSTKARKEEMKKKMKRWLLTGEMLEINPTSCSGTGASGRLSPRGENNPGDPTTWVNRRPRIGPGTGTGEDPSSAPSSPPLPALPAHSALPALPPRSTPPISMIPESAHFPTGSTSAVLASSPPPPIPPPKYGSDSKSTYIAELDRSASMRRNEKESYLTQVDRTSESGTFTGTNFVQSPLSSSRQSSLTRSEIEEAERRGYERARREIEESFRERQREH